MRRSSLHLAAVASIALSHLAISWYWGPSIDTFPIDDPYIHLVYGANLAAGEGFAFNRGEPSMGTSSPLWTLVVAGATLFSSNVVGAMALFGSALLFVSGLCLYALLFRLLTGAGARPLVAAATAVVGAFVLLTSGNVLWISFSGMETVLYVAEILVVALLHAPSSRSERLGLALGLVLAVLTRLSAVCLVAAVAISALATRERPARGVLAPLLAPVAALAAFSAYSWQAIGTLLPTTVGGKKASYVPGEIDLAQAGEFVFDYFSFLSHEPVYLMLVPWLLGCGVWTLVRVWLGVRQGVAMRFGVPELLSVWALMHLGVFVLTFRSLLHYGRYFVPLMPASLVLGVFGLQAAAGRIGPRLRFLPVAVLALAGAVNVTELSRWKSLYANDIRHIRETYVASATWVRDHTPKDAVIAAYDIGALKHYSGRRIVDLFGLLDERVHPLLRKRDAASYVRDSQADYVLYLQSPNSEHHTRVYLAEYGRDALLDQRLLATFRSKPYPQPTVTQSFEIDAYQIRAWHSVDASGRRKQFVRDASVLDSVDPVGAQFGSGLELVGVTLGAERRASDYVVRRVLRVPTLGFRITLFWRVLAAQRRLPDVEVSFVAPEDGRVWYSMRHPIAHGRVDGLVAPGEIVREPHFVWLPPDVPNGPLVLHVRAFARGTSRTLRVGPTSDLDATAATLRIVAPEHVGL